MAKAIYYGSICIDNILSELVQTGNDGKSYLKVRIIEKDEPDTYGNVAFIIQAVAKAEQKDGVKYSLGNLKAAGDERPQPQPQGVDIKTKLDQLRQKATAPTIEPAQSDLPF